VGISGDDAACGIVEGFGAVIALVDDVESRDEGWVGFRACGDDLPDDRFVEVGIGAWSEKAALGAFVALGIDRVG
jgi:hypothetical protein